MGSRFAEDRALVRRLLAGEEAAFEAFFEHNAPRLYRFALSRLDHNEDEAEEIVQATLTRVVPRLATYRGEAALFTWLCTFCVREISARFRKRRRAPSKVGLAERIPDVERALRLLSDASEHDPERRLLRRELGDRVQLALDRLPGRYGDALEWKYAQGLSVRQIGLRLEIGTMAAQSLLARARRAFREEFERSAG